MATSIISVDISSYSLAVLLLHRLLQLSPGLLPTRLLQHLRRLLQLLAKATPLGPLDGRHEPWGLAALHRQLQLLAHLRKLPRSLVGLLW